MDRFEARHRSDRRADDLLHATHHLLGGADESVLSIEVSSFALSEDETRVLTARACLRRV